MKDKKRIPTDGEAVPWKSPFAALNNQPRPSPSAADSAARPIDAGRPTTQKHRGRVDIIRHTAHRGGKTVTVVTGFIGIGQVEKEELAKTIQKACGAGGTVKDGRIEIQGDQRAIVARILGEAGFRPVFAGG